MSIRQFTLSLALATCAHGAGSPGRGFAWMLKESQLALVNELLRQQVRSVSAAAINDAINSNNNRKQLF